MSRPAPCSTLQGRLTMALRERLEEGVRDRWIEDLACEALTHLAAELIAAEQIAGHSMTLQEGLAFLSREVEP